MVNLADKTSFDIAKYLFEEYKQHWSGNYKGNCLLLANHGELDSKRGPTPRGSNTREPTNSRVFYGGGANPVQAFAIANGLEYKEVHMKQESRMAKGFVEQFLLRFCKENQQELLKEKKNLEVDTGSSCALI